MGTLIVLVAGLVPRKGGGGGSYGGDVKIFLGLNIKHRQPNQVCLDYLIHVRHPVFIIKSAYRPPCTFL